MEKINNTTELSTEEILKLDIVKHFDFENELYKRIDNIIKIITLYYPYEMFSDILGYPFTNIEKFKLSEINNDFFDVWVRCGIYGGESWVKKVNIPLDWILIEDYPQVMKTIKKLDDELHLKNLEASK